MKKIGLLGCGAAGLHHLESMLEAGQIQVAAVCDISLNRAQKAADIANAVSYTDVEKMIKCEELDALAIITSADSHYPLLKIAAANNLHVICEKPLTVKSENGDEIVKMFEEKGLILAVTFTYRYVDETKKIKEFIDSGAIGKLLEIRHVSWCGQSTKHPEGSTQRAKYDCIYNDNIRGMIFDCGIHTFDLFSWLSGEEYISFVGQGACHEGYDYPDSATVITEMTNGVRCLYDHGPLPGYLGGEAGIALGIISVAGTEGSVVWNIVAGLDDSKDGKQKYFSELHFNSLLSHSVEKIPVFSKKRIEQYYDFAESVNKGYLCGGFPTPTEASKATRSANMAVDSVMKNIICSTNIKKAV